MGSTTTNTSIANRALQLMGYQPINNLLENSLGAKAMNRAYYPVLYSELRKNWWNFAIKRAVLPADAIPPAYGKANYFSLPPDFLDLAAPDSSTGISGAVAGPQIFSGTVITDWQIEGTKIATDQAAPLMMRYVSSAVTESMFDPCFDEAFSAALAMMTCEELTQSNTKLQNISQIYDAAIELAKKRNAFEGRPVQPPTDTYILARF